MLPPPAPLHLLPRLLLSRTAAAVQSLCRLLWLPMWKARALLVHPQHQHRQQQQALPTRPLSMHRQIAPFQRPLMQMGRRGLATELLRLRPMSKLLALLFWRRRLQRRMRCASPPSLILFRPSPHHLRSCSSLAAPPHHIKMPMPTLAMCPSSPSATTLTRPLRPLHR